MISFIIIISQEAMAMAMPIALSNSIQLRLLVHDLEPVLAQPEKLKK
jgi:hypothetical protein